MPEVLKPKCGQTSEATGTGAASVQFLVRSAHQRRMCFDLWTTFDCIPTETPFLPGAYHAARLALLGAASLDNGRRAQAAGGRCSGRRCDPSPSVTPARPRAAFPL